MHNADFVQVPVHKLFSYVGYDLSWFRSIDLAIFFFCRPLLFGHLRLSLKSFKFLAFALLNLFQVLDLKSVYVNELVVIWGAMLKHFAGERLTLPQTHCAVPVGATQ